MAVFIRDFYKAKAHTTINGIFALNTMEIGPDHLAGKLYSLVIWRSDGN
jgi:hypothetical protein